MSALGFARVRPSGDMALDVGTAGAMPCKACRKVGHDLRTYMRGERYRAIAVCRGCRSVVEF